MTWMQTISGRAVDFLVPEPASIEITDIAYSLARLARFNGHAKGLYSVAQHSVHVAEHCARPWQLAALLHDAPEAYIGDLTSPMKEASPELAQAFDRIEQRIASVIAGRFGLQLDDFTHPSIKEADLRMLATEKRDVMSRSVRAWKPLPPPYRERIETCWPIHVAQEKFLRMFAELTA